MNKEFEKYISSIPSGHVVLKARQVGKSNYSMLIYESIFGEERERKRKLELRNSKIDELLG